MLMSIRIKDDPRGPDMVSCVYGIAGTSYVTVVVDDIIVDGVVVRQVQRPFLVPFTDAELIGVYRSAEEELWWQRQ